EVARTRLARIEILPRLSSRYVAEGDAADDARARDYLELGPTKGETARRLSALEAGLRERPSNAPAVGSALAAAVERIWTNNPGDPLATALAARLGRPRARERAERVAADPAALLADRLAMIRVLAESPEGPPTAILLPIATNDPTPSLQLAALDALSRDDSHAIADALLAAYAQKPGAWQARAREAMLGRKSWAGAFLNAVDRGTIDPKTVPTDALRAVAAHGDETLDALVRRHWGNVSPGTPEEKLAEVRRLNNDLRAFPGDARKGRDIFIERCSSCHQLFGEGKAVGPDLTLANRSDRDYLLVSLVDPGAVVRKEYQGGVVATRDGRVLTGLITEAGPGTLAITGSTGERIEIARAEVESIRESPVSVMPEDLYRQLSPGDLRDLFAYLQGGPSRP
ncbi:MAG: c-type cytochrome, partial [Isosphaeraceae bacterium]